MKLRAVAIGVAIFLATPAQPADAGSLDSSAVARGRSAVLFDDSIQQISYVQGNYFVIGASESGSTSAYSGIFDSNRELSEINALGFRSLGFSAKSIYEYFSAEDVARLIQPDIGRYTRTAGLGKPVPIKQDALSQEARQALLDQGVDYLVVCNWIGFQLIMPGLGMSTAEKSDASYWIVDLRTNSAIVQGNVWAIDKVNIGKATGKEFLEADNLAGLRRELKRWFEGRFRTNSGGRSVQKALGIKEIK